MIWCSVEVWPHSGPISCSISLVFPQQSSGYIEWGNYWANVLKWYMTQFKITWISYRQGMVAMKLLFMMFKVIQASSHSHNTIITPTTITTTAPAPQTPTLTPIPLNHNHSNHQSQQNNHHIPASHCFFSWQSYPWLKVYLGMVPVCIKKQSFNLNNYHHHHSHHNHHHQRRKSSK